MVIEQERSFFSVFGTFSSGSSTHHRLFSTALIQYDFCNLAEILSKNSSDFRGWEVLSSHESAGVSLKLLDALSYSAILIVICICQKCVVKTSLEQELAYYKNALFSYQAGLFDCRSQFRNSKPPMQKKRSIQSIQNASLSTLSLFLLLDFF